MSKSINRRIFAAVLATIMTFSMSVCAFEDVFAAENEDAENYESYESEEVALAENQQEAEIEYNRIVHDETLFRKLTDKTISVPQMLLNPWGGLLNLRESIGESYSGYSVVQGGCTDGQGYAYYLMNKSSTDKGRIAKFRLSDNACVQVSGVLNTCHGNGIAYDSKRNAIVVIAREERKQEITIVDATTLTITRQENVKYENYKNYEDTKHELNKTHQSYGLGAITYNEKYDVYLALQRTMHNIIVFDPDTFQAVGLIFTTVTKKYPGTYQAIDSDDQYVYFLLSPDGSSQPNNVFVALDWNSENLMPYANYKAKQAAEKEAEAQNQLMEQQTEPLQNSQEEELVPYIEHPWYCNDNKSGEPDAAITITGVHEAENIFHITDPNTGARHFYLASYYSHTEYKWVNKRVAYKVKWKQVWSKVKWKQVRKKYRKKGKTYYKYVWKYKRKKVWKYKTKYKNVTERVYDYLGREDYVYDLGTI